MLASLIKEPKLASTPTPPAQRLHHGNPIWRTRWYDDRGKRREKHFGLISDVTQRQATALYRQWLTQWTNQDRIRNPQATQYTYTCAELARDYLEHARRTYVKRGRPTSTVWNTAYAMQSLLDTFGDRPASSVEGPEIAALRDSMIHGTDAKGDNYIRSIKTVNDRLYLIKQAFRWGREKGLVAKDNMFDVAQVKPLQSGRCDATPSEPVQPIDEHWVACVKPYCATPVQAMIDLQWLTGARPGDIVIMRGQDIDRTGTIWLYQPSTHKMEHLGTRRIIPLGPRCQKIIKTFLTRAPHEFIFSPRDSRTEQLLAKHLARKTPMYPSSKKRRLLAAQEPRRRPGEHYTTETYRRAIHYACQQAQKSDPLVPTWNPNQLRHAAATRFNREFGLEDVSVMLGHADMSTTRTYAQPDLTRAIRIAKLAG